MQIIGKMTDKGEQKCYLSYIQPSSDKLNDKKWSITFNVILFHCCFLVYPTISIHDSIYKCYLLSAICRRESQEINSVKKWTLDLQSVEQ